MPAYIPEIDYSFYDAGNPAYGNSWDMPVVIFAFQIPDNSGISTEITTDIPPGIDSRDLNLDEANAQTVGAGSFIQLPEISDHIMNFSYTEKNVPGATERGLGEMTLSLWHPDWQFLDKYIIAAGGFPIKCFYAYGWAKAGISHFRIGIISSMERKINITGSGGVELTIKATDIMTAALNLDNMSKFDSSASTPSDYIINNIPSFVSEHLDTDTVKSNISNSESFEKDDATTQIKLGIQGESVVQRMHKLATYSNSFVWFNPVTSVFQVVKAEGVQEKFLELNFLLTGREEPAKYYVSRRANNVVLSFTPSEINLLYLYALGASQLGFSHNSLTSTNEGQGNTGTAVPLDLGGASQSLGGSVTAPTQETLTSSPFTFDANAGLAANITGTTGLARGAEWIYNIMSREDIATKSLFAAASQMPFKASLEIIGDPTMAGGRIIDVVVENNRWVSPSGYSTEYDYTTQRYGVVETTHSISAGSYKTSCSLINYSGLINASGADIEQFQAAHGGAPAATDSNLGGQVPK